ncbi:MAG TPA: beta-N-acetylhexosaminidase [Bacteroidales bacterium]|nr:beta-N-acetylhexosaminidase [Bacteroidales bacterium]
MKEILLLIYMIVMSMSVFGQKQILSVFPNPAETTLVKGRFILTSATKIYVDNLETSGRDAELFNEYLLKYYSFSLDISVSQRYDSNAIIIRTITEQDMPDDAYRLDVSNGFIIIEGKGAGVFYALQTLIQMLPPYKTDVFKLQRIKIYDYPQYKWRGMHLDVCRHFFTVEEIKKYIDHISFYKMNVFHWHLTDDQGWRIQIDKFPKLTSIGGYRNGTLIGHAKDTVKKYDTIRYGGYYTKEQIRDIVAYAERRHVMIVPEIEMPGHSLAALSAYPEYSCTGGPFEVAKSWGVFEDVFCTKDKTIHFLEDVLSEVMDLFPGKYIHLGGDECSKVRWEKCPECRKVMKREGFKNTGQLQHYVMRTIGKFVSSKGKTIIGWDEILEEKLSPGAVVMAWHGDSVATAAANLKHDVIMCPTDYCYFDYYQGDSITEPLAIGGNTTLEKVYSFDPAPKKITPEQRKYILGGQGNVWTEYISDFKQLEYMVFPRMIALSEVLWSKTENRAYESFDRRLQKHVSLLDMYRVNYRRLNK